MKTIALFLLTSVLACNSPASNETAPQPVQQATKEDSLYKTVIGYHDEAMPKMGKLMGYQKALQKKIDSLSGILLAKKDESASTLKKEYERIQEQLRSAEKGMNDWMDTFDPDPKIPSKEKLLEYWEDQEIKAKKMRDDIMSSLDSAKAHLGF